MNELSIDPFAFGQRSDLPDLGTIGVLIDGTMFGYTTLPAGPIASAFYKFASAYIGALQRCPSNPLEDDDLRSTHARLLHEFHAVEATATTPAQIAQAKDRQAPRRATIPNRIPSDAMSRDVYTAMMAEQQWKEQQDRLLFVRRNTKLSYTPSQEIKPGAHFIASLGPHKALIYAAILGAWLQAHAQKNLDSDGDALLNVSTLLDMMGVKKHPSGGYKTDQKQRIKDILLSLACIYVDGAYHLPNGKLAEIKGPLIKVEFGTGVSLSSYDFYVQPGKSAKQFLTRTRQTAIFFERVAKLDIRSLVERTALQIGLYLATQYRIREAGNTLQQPIRIATILEGSGLPTKAYDRHVLDFRTRIEDALDTLEECGAIEFWEYVAGDLEALPEKNWFNPWLCCRIVPEAPA